MLGQRITYGKEIELVVREATVHDDLVGQEAVLRLSPKQPMVKYGLWRQFGECCSCCLSAKGLPFDPLTIFGEDDATLLVAYERFDQLPKKLYRAWIGATAGDDLPVLVEPTNDPNLSSAESPTK